MVVLTVNNDSQFQSQLASHPNKLVVGVFIARWCAPWLVMSPGCEQLFDAYPEAVYLKVDVDVCRDTVTAQGVYAMMPTFIFYRNRVRLDCIVCGDNHLLEEKIKQYYDCTMDAGNMSLPNSEQMDLMPFILMNQCEALNESNSHPLAECFTPGDGYLESYSDNQLIIWIVFSRAVKIHSFKIQAPTTNGPKTIKLFINQPNTLGFDEATSCIPTQTLEMTTNSLECGCPIPLRYVKFQNVQNFVLFIEDNQDGSETTRIDHLQVFGTPLTTTNMNDFKRVGLKKS